MTPLVAGSLRRLVLRSLVLSALGALMPGSAPLLAQSHPAKRSGRVTVRYSEGTIHGFLALHSDGGALLAYGDLLQVPGDSSIESRMVLHFTDHSLFEETVSFTQHGVFAFLSYHLIQRGPAFAQDLDATLGRDGRYQVRSKSHKDSSETRDQGSLDLPDDVANGLVVILAKNLHAGDTADVHLVAFTPKPQLIGLRLVPDGTDTVMLGDKAEAAAVLAVQPQLGAVKRFFAKLLGKLPPDSHVWIVTYQVPAFVRFRGPMYFGPVWRLDLMSPTWPH